MYSTMKADDLIKQALNEMDKPKLRLVKTHTGEKGHTAKVYKDSDWDEHRVKFYNPDGSSHGKDSDYHTDDLDDAHDTAKDFLKRMS